MALNCCIKTGKFSPFFNCHLEFESVQAIEPEFYYSNVVNYPFVPIHVTIPVYICTKASSLKISLQFSLLAYLFSFALRPFLFSVTFLAPLIPIIKIHPHQPLLVRMVYFWPCNCKPLGDLVVLFRLLWGMRMWEVLEVGQAPVLVYRSCRFLVGRGGLFRFLFDSLPVVAPQKVLGKEGVKRKKMKKRNQQHIDNTIHSGLYICCLLYMLLRLCSRGRRIGRRGRRRRRVLWRRVRVELVRVWQQVVEVWVELEVAWVEGLKGRLWVVLELAVLGL